MKPDLTPFTSTRRAFESGMKSIELAIIYLDYKLENDYYHDTIIEILDDALQEINRLKNPSNYFGKE